MKRFTTISRAFPPQLNVFYVFFVRLFVCLIIINVYVNSGPSHFL